MGSLLLLCSCLLASLHFIEAEVDINFTTANQIRKNLNRTTSPCSNFWNFACGGFGNASEYVDNFEWVEDQFASAMVELFESHLGENDTQAPRLIGQMRSYYKACTEDMRTMNATHAPEEVTEWSTDPVNFIQHVFCRIVFDERSGVANNDSMHQVIQLQMPDPSTRYSSLRVLQLLQLNTSLRNHNVVKLVRKLQQLRDRYREENPVVYTWTYSELRQQIPNVPWWHLCNQFLAGQNTSKECDHLSFEVSDRDYIRESSQFFHDFEDYNAKHLYLRLHLYVLLEESQPRERNPKTCIHHMRAFLPLGVNYMYDRFVYQNREKDTFQLMEILANVKATFGKYLEANRLQLTTQQLAYVRAKLEGMQLKVGNLPEEKSPEFYDTHYESANFTTSNFYGNLIQALALRARLQHAGLPNPGSRLDLQRYYVNDNVRKARTSPFYENERNTITVPMEFLQWPLFDHRQHSVFQQSLLGAVLAHEMNHAFEQEGILFDAAGNESPVGLQIRESPAFRDAIRCAERKPYVSLKERLADLNGLQLAYDSFFGLDHDSRKFEYRPYAFEAEFSAPQLFHLSYAQFFCGSLPPVIAHDRDDERVNVSVGNLRQFAYDFKCEESHLPPCEMWRPNVHP
ncbi:endothelin-converting enzyme 2 [Drosophila biarmipes]|uniref:endothelin-converting enzyme 2 n=1 Tax=Drosophila biarmipes TaxID=125945 RepID=UPI0007E6D2ED|nr:endothelin-converting enzyme 2 [Drosophila biarmipes]